MNADLDEALAIARELARLAVAPVSGPGSAQLGEIGALRQRLNELEERIALAREFDSATGVA